MDMTEIHSIFFEVCHVQIFATIPSLIAR